MEEGLIDRIYEASLIPERWPQVLDSLCAVAACDKAIFFSTDGNSVGGYTCNERGQELTEKFVTENWAARNAQGARTITLREPRFLTDHDIFTDEEMAENPFYTEFLHPMNASWGTGTFVMGPFDNKIIMALYRPNEMGPVKPEQAAGLTAIRPHLARSALTAARFKLHQASAGVAALSAIGLPAAVLSASGRLIAINDLLKPLMPHTIIDSPTRMRFTRASDDKMFEDAIAKAQVSNRGGGTFPVRPKGEGGPPTIVHLQPVIGLGQDIFSSSALLMIATPVALPNAIDPLVLEGLFDLTPAEARVARGIAIGRSIRSISDEGKVSADTVRTQLKSVFSKTGTARQSELSALLGLARLSSSASGES